MLCVCVGGWVGGCCDKPLTGFLSQLQQASLHPPQHVTPPIIGICLLPPSLPPSLPLSLLVSVPDVEYVDNSGLLPPLPSPLHHLSTSPQSAEEEEEEVEEKPSVVR